MNIAARILILLLLLTVAQSLAAQETTATTTADTASTAAPAETTTDVPEGRRSLTSMEVRHEFSNLVRESPTELAKILVLEPTLLSNEAFLAGYPELARFVARHPEIRNHPRFYLGDFQFLAERRGPDFIEPLMVFAGFALFTFALGWLVRTYIEQKRWSRLSRTQSEVHTKILDRFGTTAELLEYVRTPAGTKFLESAPIPLHDSPPARNVPASRVLWSIQVGVIVAAGAIGMLIVSGRFGEDGQGLFAMGVIGICIGAGFIGSAIVSLLLSRRLGIWQGANAPDSIEDPGLVK
jgi:hypothetical protein